MVPGIEPFKRNFLSKTENRLFILFLYDFVCPKIDVKEKDIDRSLQLNKYYLHKLTVITNLNNLGYNNIYT